MNSRGYRLDVPKLAVWIGLFLVCAACWMVAAFSFFG
jgi:hypothetical protein